MTTDKNRLALAREWAGLTRAQAVKHVAIRPEDLEGLEGCASLENFTFCVGSNGSNITLDDFAKLYGARVEWLRGEVPQHDYTVVDGMRGAENLTPHDRDTVAQFAAMLQRKPGTAR